MGHTAVSTIKVSSFGNMEPERLLKFYSESLQRHFWDMPPCIMIKVKVPIVLQKG